MPGTIAVRERDQEPGIWSEWEWLVRDIEAMDRKTGVRHDFSPEAMARDSAQSLIQMREAVEIEVALRTVRVQLEPLPVEVVTSARRGPS